MPRIRSGLTSREFYLAVEWEGSARGFTDSLGRALDGATDKSMLLARAVLSNPFWLPAMALSRQEESGQKSLVIEILL